MIRVKRVSEPANARDGVQFLVDRLWPRGVKRDTLRLAGWLKDVAPAIACAAGSGIQFEGIANLPDILYGAVKCAVASSPDKG